MRRNNSNKNEQKQEAQLTRKKIEERSMRKKRDRFGPLETLLPRDPESGKVIITGGQNQEQIIESYRFITNFIENKKEMLKL